MTFAFLLVSLCISMDNENEKTLSVLNKPKIELSPRERALRILNHLKVKPTCQICYNSKEKGNPFRFTNCEKPHGPFCEECIKDFMRINCTPFLNCPYCKKPKVFLAKEFLSHKERSLIQFGKFKRAILLLLHVLVSCVVSMVFVGNDNHFMAVFVISTLFVWIR
jgi:hypothetical protein